MLGKGELKILDFPISLSRAAWLIPNASRMPNIYTHIRRIVLLRGPLARSALNAFQLFLPWPSDKPLRQNIVRKFGWEVIISSFTSLCNVSIERYRLICLSVA